MVKKIKPIRVWEKKYNVAEMSLKQKIQDQQKLCEQCSQQISEEQNFCQEQQSSPFRSQLQNNIMKEPTQTKKPQKQKNEQGFSITKELINILNQQIYRRIVLAEFIQTNDSYHALDDESINSSFKKEITKVKQTQKQKISSFVFQQSLSIPLYYKQFQKPQNVQSQKLLQKKHSDIQIPAIQKLQKRQFLLYSNNLMLDLTNIKFLNIYGPTGSGKTYMLKSIFKQHQIEKNVIWINGMSILKGKTKRFLSDIKNRLDSLMWNIYLANCQKQKNAQVDFFPKLFDKENERIVVLDQYDQAAHFDMVDLLRYSYLKGLQGQRQNLNQKISSIFFISKIILVSNTFSSEINQRNQEDQITTKKKTLYIDNLVFRPFCEKQAVQILKGKISKVNQKSNKLNEMLQQIFQDKQSGIFTDQKLLHLIKKICYGDEVDIRKILFFYTDSIKRLIQILQQKFEKNPSKLVKKFKNHLIDDKFLMGFLNNQANVPEVEDQENSHKKNHFIENDQNPIVYYIFNLEIEGKNILIALHKQMNFQNKLKRQESYQNQNQDAKKIKKSQNEKTFLEKRKQHIVRVQDLYKKIRPRIQFTKIFHWLYEFQQVGLLRIRKDLSSFACFQSRTQKLSSQIKIMDNYQIQILDRQSIQKGLQIY